MAIKHVVTRGFGFADGVKFIVTRGYTSSIVIAPDKPGQTFTMPANRNNYIVGPSRNHYTMPAGRNNYEAS